MFTLRLLASLAVTACCLTAVGTGQENAAPGQSQDSELREMRQAIGQQSARIEELARQIARLAALVEKGRAPADTATPAQTDGLEAETQPQEPEIRKAEAAPQGQAHVVTKGETPTSIARLYKVTVAELLQANKIVDDRKLQIGQTLIIPVRNTESTESSHTPSGGN